MTKKRALNMVNGHILRLDIKLHEIIDILIICLCMKWTIVRTYIIKFQSKLTEKHFYATPILR